MVSGWVGAEWKFQLNSAQMVTQVNLIPYKEETAAVWISSCQAKQLQVNCTLFFLIVSQTCKSYCALSSYVLMSPLGLRSPLSPPFLLNFHYLLARTFPNEVKPGDTEWPRSHIARKLKWNSPGPCSIHETLLRVSPSDSFCPLFCYCV